MFAFKVLGINMANASHHCKVNLLLENDNKMPPYAVERHFDQLYDRRTHARTHPQKFAEAWLKPHRGALSVFSWLWCRQAFSAFSALDLKLGRGHEFEG